MALEKCRAKRLWQTTFFEIWVFAKTTTTSYCEHWKKAMRLYVRANYCRDYSILAWISDGHSLRGISLSLMVPHSMFLHALFIIPTFIIAKIFCERQETNNSFYNLFQTLSVHIFIFSIRTPIRKAYHKYLCSNYNPAFNISFPTPIF